MQSMPSVTSLASVRLHPPAACPRSSACTKDDDAVVCVRCDATEGARVRLVEWKRTLIRHEEEEENEEPRCVCRARVKEMGGGRICVRPTDASGTPASAIAVAAGGYGHKKVLRVYDGHRAFAGMSYHAIRLDVTIEDACANETADDDDISKTWEEYWSVTRVERRDPSDNSAGDAQWDPPPASWRRLENHEWSLHVIGANGKPRAPNVDRDAYSLRRYGGAKAAAENASRHALLIHTDHEVVASSSAEWKVTLVTFRAKRESGAIGWTDRGSSFIIQTQRIVLCRADVERALRPRSVVSSSTRGGSACPCFVATCFCRPAAEAALLGLTDDDMGCDEDVEVSYYCCAGACGTRCECFVLGCAGHGDEDERALQCLPPCSVRTYGLTRHDGGFIDELTQPIYEADFCTPLCSVLGFIVCLGLCCSPASRTDITFHRWLTDTANLPRGGRRLRQRGPAGKYVADDDDSSSHDDVDDDDDSDDDENDDEDGTRSARAYDIVICDSEREEDGGASSSSHSSSSRPSSAAVAAPADGDNAIDGGAVVTAPPRMEAMSCQ